MSEIANSEGVSETEMPAPDIQFPPFPDPKENDFEDDISEEERTYYKNKFKDLNHIKSYRIHCTSCDRHMGCSARNDRIRAHPLLRTLVCNSCHSFYNSGEFEKGDDGSELYCRWWGQGGQVYCCSDCPHVFCAKCIRRNLGIPKIKEIENAEDWKCFKCNPESLRDLRAICWAVLRYCDLKNKITYLTEDPELKAAYQKECALDPSECCKHKSNRRSQKVNESLNKKKEVKKEPVPKTTTANIIAKIPSTIQVKKFASINADDSNKLDKKPQKRAASPKLGSILIKNPVSMASSVTPKILTPIAGVPPLAKKLRLPSTVNTSIKVHNMRENKSVSTYVRIKPKVSQHLPIPIINNCFNGYNANMFQCNNNLVNDNINLSLDSLTQGLDMAAVVAMSNNTTQDDDDDVVCTPDFPLEPLCEVTEDNDDDVECITPGPIIAPKITNPPPLIPRSTPTAADISSDNIIQMTDNDVTVNETTGGLKFRVDPQTLSSNKMYRLPDGRIFAINANPNMPGGYSATIVAVQDSNKTVPKGAIFAAKLSAISTSTPAKSNSNQASRFVKPKPNITKVTNTITSITTATTKPTKTSETSSRKCDLNVPVEWYRYNLIDAIDTLEYSLSRLHKLKKETTSVYLRTRSVNEMGHLHKTLERILNTSSSRFTEIRENLNKGLKQYIQKKTGCVSSEEDDDVEILPDVNEDPIFIDENSVESNINDNENPEVDLTGPGSSEHNDSEENKNNDESKGDPLQISGDNDSDFVLSVRSELLENTQTNKRTTRSSYKNAVNGVEKSRKDSDRKNDKTRNINIVTRKNRSEDAAAISRTRNEKADNQINNENMDNVTSKLQSPVDKDDLDSNMEILEDKLPKYDKTDQDQGHDNKVQDIKHEFSDSDHKQQNADTILDVVINEEKKTQHTQVKLEENFNDEMESSTDKMEDSVEKMEDSIEKMEDSIDKMDGSSDKMEDSINKMEDPIEKMKDSIDKMEDSINTMEDSINTMEDPVDKMEDSLDKMEESISQIEDLIGKVDNIDDKMENPNSSIKESDRKMDDIEDLTQFGLEKCQNNDDKMQDSAITEELIETLLKDDSQDCAPTNSEVPKPLSVK